MVGVIMMDEATKKSVEQRLASAAGHISGIARMVEDGTLEHNPITGAVAAVSVGVVNDELQLDLCYEEDSAAEVDLNVVMTGSGRIVEIRVDHVRRERRRLRGQLSLAGHPRQPAVDRHRRGGWYHHSADPRGRLDREPRHSRQAV